MQQEAQEVRDQVDHEVWLENQELMELQEQKDPQDDQEIQDQS